MDGFGIVYLIENAQEFWSGACGGCPSPTFALLTPISELEDILKVPANASLSLLDATLKRSLSFCASYHGTCRALARRALLTSWHLQNNTCRALYNLSMHANSYSIQSSLSFTRSACARS